MQPNNFEIACQISFIRRLNDDLVHANLFQ